MSSADAPSLLLNHTLETLCLELASGRAVQSTPDSDVFQFESKATRAIFEWYRRNREKWAGLNRTDDVREIARQVDEEPPTFPPTAEPEGPSAGRLLHLKRVRAHRFAGIHAYGTPDEPPPVFELEIDATSDGRLCIIEGCNGAGKTSLLSAISWCLTGHIYRSQRIPEEISSFDVSPNGDGATGQTISAITPVPPKDLLDRLGNERIPLDTWVELTFVDDDGNEVGTIKRSITRPNRGRQINVSEPDFSALRLSPIAREIGTKIPGLLPYIQVGREPDDLAKAVAELTGIRPLRDLVKHARKSQEKLRRNLRKERQDKIDKLDEEYASKLAELSKLTKDHKDIAPKTASPIDPADKACKDQLVEIKEHFGTLQAQRLADAAKILGETFDENDAKARKDLSDNVGPAIGAANPRTMANLPSAKRLRDLASLTDEEISHAESLIRILQEQADELAKLEKEQNLATRIRLYAKVAEWIKQMDPEARGIADCPVCQTSLTGKVDPITGKPVVEHIRAFLDSDSDHLEHTISQWAQLALNKLSGKLADTLSSELTADLPEKPVDLVTAALSEELFRAPAFAATLKPLKRSMQELCEQHSTLLPQFTDPPAVDWPEAVSRVGHNLPKAVLRARRAIDFARWRQKNKAKCGQFFQKTVGTVDSAPDRSAVGEEDPKEWPLLKRLAALKDMVDSTEPLRSALTRVEEMTQYLSKRRIEEAWIIQYENAAVAIEPLFKLEKLVDKQVGSLMEKLSSEMADWKQALYNPAHVGAPKIGSTDLGKKGSLVIGASLEGTEAPAEHVCNVSDLRANLLAFLFAFWSHRRETQGGLSLLLLDDLQELFDPRNRLRVARAIPRMAAERKAHVILTTNDHEFGRTVRKSANEGLSPQQIDHRQILPPKPVGLVISLSEFLDSIQKKRSRFEKNVNDDEAAQDYLNQLRIYLEQRLVNLFDTADPAISRQPTLADLMGGIRRRVNGQMEPFSQQAFRALVNDLAFVEGSEFLRLMNESHHNRAHLIAYNDVVEIKRDCKRALDLVHSADEAYERWSQRVPAETIATRPPIPAARRDIDFSVPMILATAAADRDSPLYDVSEPEEEPFDADWLTNHAIYVNVSDNLGFAGSKGCRVVVDLDDQVPPDNSLVVALRGDDAYVRRLSRPEGETDKVCLTPEDTDPRRRQPAILASVSEVRLFEIVGVIFDYARADPWPSSEAELDEKCQTLNRVEIALKVRGESALPLVLEDQTILGGPRIEPADLPGKQGELVVIYTSEGTAFKRVGKAVTDTVRQFESIGGLGESLLVRTENLDDDPLHNLPLLKDARAILGVLYDPNK